MSTQKNQLLHLKEEASKFDLNEF